MSVPIVIYGAGGFAREVAWLAEECGHEVKCFIDDNRAHGPERLNDFPVLSLTEAAERFPGAHVCAAIGSPAVRRTVTERALEHGLRPVTLIDPRVQRSRWVTFGDGAVVCAGAILTTNITIGDHVQINLDCTIGHDVRMAEYSTLAPGVHVSGWVFLGAGAYVGTGAVIINGNQSEPLTIGDGAVIGAGACVTRSVEPRTTVVGVPAKPVGRK
jgi:sugar O-acyltransferase (sialic acid O-acetyltransferase NeuD family)